MKNALPIILGAGVLFVLATRKSGSSQTRQEEDAGEENTESTEENTESTEDASASYIGTARPITPIDPAGGRSPSPSGISVPRDPSVNPEIPRPSGPIRTRLV